MTATRGAQRGPDAAAPGGTLVFPLQLRRVQRMLVVRELADSLPGALALFGAGLAGLRGAATSTTDRVLGAAELASSAWMLLLLRRSVRELFGRRASEAGVAPAAALPALEEQHGDVEWSGVAGAAMLGVETWQHWHDTGRVQRPVVLLAVFTLFMATRGRLLIARAARARLGDRRPRLALSPEGIDYRGSRRRRFAARWDEVARVEHDAGAVTLALRDGRTFALRAREHVDGEALVAAVRAALPAVLPPSQR